MNDPIQTIITKREQILTGEIGALLHDIGKCHPDFVRKQSIENVGNFDHCKIDEFLDSNLITLMKNGKFEINIKNEKTDVYSIITEHCERKTKKELIKLMKSCDILDSADDKGIVRKKQPMNDTIISSPFGYPRERIDLKCLQCRLFDLSHQLTDLFDKYVSNSIDITTFRENVINNLMLTFSHALGETRIPSNDVTLWDHSHSTASLFKSMLCKMALKEIPDEQWRIFGFCWNGTGFIGRGKKVADILERNRIIESIEEELKKKFEDEIPVGNTIYDDTNGIYFTFPDLESDNLEEVACECAKKGMKIIRCNSDGEIFPLFVVSEPSRSLTILADVLRFASAKRNIPKLTPTLFFLKNSEEGENLEVRIESNPEMPLTHTGQDICLICQIRAKSIDLETCDSCDERRKGRLDKWFSNREHTIWMDEIADTNNNVALLTLEFDLDRWLDGTMIETIYSQTFEDWYVSRGKRVHDNRQYIKRISNSLGIEIKYQVSKKSLAGYFMEYFVNEVLRDPHFKDRIDVRTDVLDTFFEEFSIKKKEKNQNGEYDPLYVRRVWENLKLRTKSETTESMMSLLFTQNPSPARLLRIWKEMKEFLESIIKRIENDTGSNKWKRIKFSIDSSSLSLKNNSQLEPRKPYIIKIRDLNPEILLVLYSPSEEFHTIESLDKFNTSDLSGFSAVETALKSFQIYFLAEEDNPNENILEDGKLMIVKSTEKEDYYPFIEITKSPICLRIIVPASNSMSILRLITKMYNERFGKVMGKLPLNAGLLVSKRKFPLYVLLDAGERILGDNRFKQPVIMDPYWDVTEARNDKNYGFYPTVLPRNRHYTLDDIEPLSRGKPYALYPGYFDFNLLTSTTSRYYIRYEDCKRADEDYRILSGRPYYFYQISQMMDIWEIVSNNLSGSQKTFVEEILSNKLMEWKTVSDPHKKVIFREFVETVLIDAFADKWKHLRRETQDFLVNSAIDKLLLDALILYRHVTKTQEVDRDEDKLS